MHAKSLQLCPTLCNPMDSSPQGYSGENPWDSLGKNTGVGLPFPSPINWCSYWKIVWWFLKTKNRFTIFLAIPLLGMYTEKLILQKYMHPNVHSSIIYNSQDMEATYVFINTWMDKDVGYIYIIEYYLAIKRIKSCHLQQHAWTWKALYLVK